MVGLKSSPGSQNGTGLLQTVIAMKARAGRFKNIPCHVWRSYVYIYIIYIIYIYVLIHIYTLIYLYTFISMILWLCCFYFYFFARIYNTYWNIYILLHIDPYCNIYYNIVHIIQCLLLSATYNMYVCWYIYIYICLMMFHMYPNVVCPKNCWNPTFVPEISGTNLRRVCRTHLDVSKCSRFWSVFLWTFFSNQCGKIKKHMSSPLFRSWFRAHVWPPWHS